MVCCNGEERGTSRQTNVVPLKVTYDKRHEFFFYFKLKENSSVNTEKDNVLLVLSKAPVPKCFPKHFCKWFIPDKL